MVYFTSDLHLGHANYNVFGLRGFSSVGQMDETLIERWNARVGKADTVYILGDLIFENNGEPLSYLSRLNGRKRLIVGNHDVKWLKTLGMAEVSADGTVAFCNYSEYFDEIAQYMERKIGGTVVTLCHYPMYEWKNSRKFGSVKKLGFCIHGHIHNRTDDFFTPILKLPHALNAGVDINGLAPATFDELVINNEAFKLQSLADPLDRAEYIGAKYHMYRTDKAGKPYIAHLRAVAARLDGKTEKCVAFLHDVLEDTDIDEKLLADNFSHEIVSAVKAMTHEAQVDYFDYIENISHNPIATKVKLADLKHNMDLSRLKTVTDADIARVEKYKKAYDILLKRSSGAD
ncbi:MAG: metallophosphoesterase [Clostridiales bacterium]|nr:metallophosphoesterase [Clostridiales bacterium]